MQQVPSKASFCMLRGPWRPPWGDIRLVKRLKAGRASLADNSSYRRAVRPLKLY